MAKQKDKEQEYDIDTLKKIYPYSEIYEKGIQEGKNMYKYCDSDMKSTRANGIKDGIQSERQKILKIIDELWCQSKKYVECDKKDRRNIDSGWDCCILELKQTIKGEKGE